MWLRKHFPSISSAPDCPCRDRASQPLSLTGGCADNQTNTHPQNTLRTEHTCHWKEPLLCSESCTREGRTRTLVGSSSCFFVVMRRRSQRWRSGRSSTQSPMFLCTHEAFCAVSQDNLAEPTETDLSSIVLTPPKDEDQTTVALLLALQWSAMSLHGMRSQVTCPSSTLTLDTR